MAEKRVTPPPVRVIWVLGTLAIFTIFALIAGYSQQMTYVYTDYSRQRAADRLQTLAKLQKDENQALETLDWVDQNKKTIRIPIETAMTREMGTLLMQPAGVGCVIPGAVPAPAPAPVPATTNAAPVNAKAPAIAATPSTNAAPVQPKAPAKPKQ